MSGYDKEIQIPLTLNGNTTMISVVVEPTVLEQIQKGLSPDTTQYRLTIESNQVIIPTALNTNAIKELFHDTDDIKNSILCGKKNATSKNPGNLIYKQYMKENRGHYQSCNGENEKKVFIKKVYYALIENNHRFLLSEGKGWKEMDQKDAFRKIGQALREKRLHSDIDDSPPRSTPKTPSCFTSEGDEGEIEIHTTISNDCSHQLAQNTEVFTNSHDIPLSVVQAQEQFDFSIEENVFKTPTRKSRKLSEAFDQDSNIDSDSSLGFNVPTDVKRVKTGYNERPDSSFNLPTNVQRVKSGYNERLDSSLFEPLPILHNACTWSPSMNFDLSQPDREATASSQCVNSTICTTLDEYRDDESQTLQPRQLFAWPNQNEQREDEEGSSQYFSSLRDTICSPFTKL
jgi:hypothetical protein